MLSLILISLLNSLVVNGKNLGMEMEQMSLMTKELLPSERSLDMYESPPVDLYQSPYNPTAQYSDRYSAEVEMENSHEPYASCSKPVDHSTYNPYDELCAQTASTDYSLYKSEPKQKVETLNEVLEDLSNQKQTKPGKRPKKGKTNTPDKYSSYNSDNQYGSNDYYKPKQPYQSDYSSEGYESEEYYKPPKQPYQSDYSSEKYSTDSYEADPTYSKPGKKPYESNYGSEGYELGYGSESYGKPNQKPYDSTYSEDDDTGYQPNYNDSYYDKSPKKSHEKESKGGYSGSGAYPEPYPTVDYTPNYQSKPKEIHQTYTHQNNKQGDMRHSFDKKFPDTNDVIDF